MSKNEWISIRAYAEVEGLSIAAARARAHRALPGGVTRDGNWEVRRAHSSPRASIILRRVEQKEGSDDE